MREAEVGSLHVPGVCCAERWWVYTGGSQSGSHTLSSPSSQLAAPHAVLNQVGSGEEMKHVCVLSWTCGTVCMCVWKCVTPATWPWEEGGREGGGEGGDEQKENTNGLKQPPNLTPTGLLPPAWSHATFWQQYNIGSRIVSLQQSTHKYPSLQSTYREREEKKHSNSKTNAF